ncbi:MAG: hypothetical protein ABEL76_03080 [Bradymonadaceae bacterium]
MRAYDSASQLVACGIGVAALLLAADARAAEFTDVLDAADDKGDYSEETYDPFDFNLETGFEFKTTKATINREAPCNPEGSGDGSGRVEGSDRCSETSIVTNKEALYRHQEATLDVTLRIGMFKDLELRLNAPYVLTSNYAMKYANEASDPSNRVDASNSSIDPTDQTIRRNARKHFQGQSRAQKKARLNRFEQHRFFDLSGSFTDNQYTRSGFGDPSLGLRWAPYNDQRNDTKATLMFGFDYVMPIAKIRQAENSAVGEGMHKLRWDIRSSKQFNWIDPYFGLDYQLSIAARNSPIKELKEVDTANTGQSVTFPPHKGHFTVGTEFIPYENEETHEKYVIDTRFVFGYTSEGRDYTPLYEHMVNSDCNGMTTEDILPKYRNGKLQNPDGVGCSWIAQRPANIKPTPKYNLTNLEPGSNGDSFETNGIMTVESYATFTGRLGFHAQPSEYFQIKAIVELRHQQQHLLTNARTGNDVDDNREKKSNDDKVDLTGKDAKIERNPAYNSTYDSSGGGFEVSGFNTWRFLLNAAVQF